MRCRSSSCEKGLFGCLVVNGRGARSTRCVNQNFDVLNEKNIRKRSVPFPILHEDGIKHSGTDLDVQVNFAVERQIILAPRFSTLPSHRLFTVAQNHDTSPIIHLHRDNDTNVLGSGSRAGTAVPSRASSGKSSGDTNWTWSVYWLRFVVCWAIKRYLCDL